MASCAMRTCKSRRLRRSPRRRRTAPLPSRRSRRQRRRPPRPVAQVRAPAPVDDKPQAGPTLLGVTFEILPVGTLRATEAGTTNVSIDSAFAVAVAMALDFPASPYFAIGLSPKVIFRVKNDGTERVESAKGVNDFRLQTDRPGAAVPEHTCLRQDFAGLLYHFSPGRRHRFLTPLLIPGAFSSIPRWVSRPLVARFVRHHRPRLPGGFSVEQERRRHQYLRRQPVPPPRRRLRGRLLVS